MLLYIASLISSMDVHDGMPVIALNAYMLNLVTGTTLSSFSVWFCPDSMFTLKRTAPGLYSIQILY